MHWCVVKEVAMGRRNFGPRVSGVCDSFCLRQKCRTSDYAGHRRHEVSLKSGAARLLVEHNSQRDKPSSYDKKSNTTLNRENNGFISVMMITATQVPVGSEIFSLISLLVISLGVLLILRHYLPLRTTAAYLLVPIFFALFLPASIVLLVPIDLASIASEEDAGNRGIWLPDRVLLVAWRICYWLTFALTW